MDWWVRTKDDELARSQGYYYDEAEAAKLVAFLHKYARPKFIRPGQPFRLLQWQEQFICYVMCWRDPSGKRRFLNCLLFTSKKSGKTLLCALLALVELYLSREPAPQVLSVATNREQARQIGEEMKATIRRHPTLKKSAKVMKSEIVIPHRDARYLAAGADGDMSAGFNASLAILDECAFHKSRNLMDQLEHATVGREQPLTILISTAGDDQSHWFFAEYTRAKKLLAGEISDLTHASFVYEADPTQPLDDPKQWKAASPSLDEYPGYTTERFRKSFTTAKTGGKAAWINFKKKRLNLWSEMSAESWLDVAVWDQRAVDIPETVLVNCPCYLGVDLAQRLDPVSISAVFVLPDGRYYVKCWGFVCKEGCLEREKQNLERYETFGLTITGGNTYDDALVENRLKELIRRYKVKAVNFDNYGAVSIGGRVQAATGVRCTRMTMSGSNMTEPCNKWEQGVNSGKVVHDGDPWLRYGVGNVLLKVFNDGNCTIAKPSNHKKIDAVASSLVAFADAIQHDVKPTVPAVVNKRPVRMISC